ncbi:DUF4179 domain-containing protein [Peribacillus butanolivorans]|uniref:DUF4179 domain-containing protein n=1 Tax=Peribacillus butanolivorans TaxID=421767 RepID=UPI00207C2B53|nr:DUF4179 domain-containing protein [Peribacillus butanolivorans]MCO0600243.1 DUF4179 domain-containing protein [Peribacillus butanolivorans]
MKDIYELLNDIDIDETEFEEMEVTELEKAKVKRTLKKSISNKKKMKGWQKKVLAASIIFGISTATIGLSFTASAKSIPSIGDIFSFFGNGNTGLYDDIKNDGKGLYSDYKNYSNEIGLTEESNGLTFTINDAIYDGKTVTITYTIESEEDLGDGSFYIPGPQIKEMKAQAGSDGITKVADKKYVGLLTASNLDELKEDTVNIDWDINSISITDTNKEIKGNWNFAFSLKATESNEKVINKSVDQYGVKVSVEKIAISPMSFVVHYNQEVSDLVKNKWDEVYVELTIKDDLGNVYAGQGNGGKGFGSYNMSWSKTFQKIDQNATKLIATPHLSLRNFTSENHGEVTITEDGKEKVSSFPTKPSSAPKELVLDDIVIDLKK